MKLSEIKDKVLKKEYNASDLIKLFCMLLLAVSIVAVIFNGIQDLFQRDKYNKLSQSVAVSPTPDSTPQPSPSAQPVILPQFEELHASNPDFYGWVKIEDTVLDYPVMHTPQDPEKYLRKTFDGEYYIGGTPFLDYRCTADSDNLILYGHNMNNGTMFTGIIKYADSAYWQQHPTVKFSTLYEEKEYRVMAAFYDRIYYDNEDCFKFYNFVDAQDKADFDNAIENYKAKALYDTGITPQYGDQLITLITCSYHHQNGRFVLVAADINNESGE